LNVQLRYNHVSNVFQSSYKRFNLTGTALMKVHNNKSLSIDTGKVITLKLLDLSGAFDTIDYSLLLDRLSDWYDISGISLTCIRSFLPNNNIHFDLSLP